MQSTCRPTVYTSLILKAYTRDLHMPILKMTVGLFICDDVSFLCFRYMLRPNPKHRGGRDPSNYRS